MKRYILAMGLVLCCVVTTGVTQAEEWIVKREKTYTPVKKLYTDLQLEYEVPTGKFAAEKVNAVPKKEPMPVQKVRWLQYTNTSGVMRANFRTRKEKTTALTDTTRGAKKRVPRVTRIRKTTNYNQDSTKRTTAAKRYARTRYIQNNTNNVDDTNEALDTESTGLAAHVPSNRRTLAKRAKMLDMLQIMKNRREQAKNLPE